MYVQTYLIKQLSYPNIIEIAKGIFKEFNSKP